MSQTKFSISEVNRRTGISRTTIQKHIKQGTLNCERKGKKKVLLDASELSRVYGDKWDNSFKTSHATGQPRNLNNKTAQGVQQEVNILREQLEKEIQERTSERENFREQIENLRDSLRLAQEGQNKTLLLLENQSTGGGGLQQSIQALEDRFEKRVGELKEEALKDAKNLTWWQLLFK